MQKIARVELSENCVGVEKADGVKTHSQISLVYASNRIISER